MGFGVKVEMHKLELVVSILFFGKYYYFVTVNINNNSVLGMAKTDLNTGTKV